jgi:Zn-dependent peptidase ImmA (M78 family)
MSNRIPVSCYILKRARETAGLSIEDVARRLNKDVDFVINVENGDQLVTYHQLEVLAYELYKRPIALFFYPFYPIEDPVEKDFRSIPASESTLIDRDTRLKIRDAKYHQLSLYELNPETVKTKFNLLRHLNGSTNLDDVTSAIRDLLGISIGEQKSFKTIRDAFKRWRGAFEDIGIYVFKDAFENPNYCGFTLYDDMYPIIYVNNKNTQTRQIFTLFHEMYHIILKSSDISCINESSYESLYPLDTAVEQRCNAFASSFLLPRDDFDKELSKKGEVDDNSVERIVKELAELYSVSRETVLRRLKDNNLVSNDLYSSLSSEWTEQMRRFRKGSQGGDYIATKMTYLSGKYLALVTERYNAGKITSEQLVQFMKVKSFDTAEKIYDRYHITGKQ